MSFSRTLVFRSDTTITADNPVAIMLTFDKTTTIPSMDQVAWRVLEFGGPSQFATVNYIQNLIFSSVEIVEGNMVTAVADTVISIGQQTSLQASGTGGAVIFTPPVAGTSDMLEAINNSGKKQGLAIGYLDNQGFPNPLLVWPNVGNKSAVAAKYTPTMSAYVTSNYVQTEIITGEIISPILLTTNLATLPDTQVFDLSANSDGSYSILPANPTFAVLKAKVKFDPGFDDYVLAKDPSTISVVNNLRSVISVKVTNTSFEKGSTIFYKVQPGATEAWTRKGPEVISVNVGGAGRVANYMGILGKKLRINRA